MVRTGGTNGQTPRSMTRIGESWNPGVLLWMSFKASKGKATATKGPLGVACFWQYLATSREGSFLIATLRARANLWTVVNPSTIHCRERSHGYVSNIRTQHHLGGREPRNEAFVQLGSALWELGVGFHLDERGPVLEASFATVLSGGGTSFASGDLIYVGKGSLLACPKPSRPFDLSFFHFGPMFPQGSKRFSRCKPGH